MDKNDSGKRADLKQRREAPLETPTDLGTKASKDIAGGMNAILADVLAVMSYQEKLVGSTVDLVFGLALLLVYLVLAGQYESWLTPVPVLLAVPLSLVGTVSLAHARRIAE